MDEAEESLISVVLPAFNAGKYIGKTLKSVSNQTHKNIEIIVVDDGSDDDTAAVIESAAVADSRIKLVKSSRRGVSHARNLAISRARGEMVATIDADDLWHKDKLSMQLEVLGRSDRETGVVYCWAAGINEADDVILPVWAASYARGHVLHDIVMRGILSCGSTPLIRKKYIEMAGGYDESLHLAEDWKFYTALAAVCRFEVIPRCLVGYRLRNDSTSVSLDAMSVALERCTDWIRSRWPAIPVAVFREREFMLGTYLAFMAVRESKYKKALKYLIYAAWQKPGRLIGLQIWELALLIPLHALGLRRYEWRLWRKPLKFEL